jgi:hypothetical protein
LAGHRCKGTHDAFEILPPDPSRRSVNTLHQGGIVRTGEVEWWGLSMRDANAVHMPYERHDDFSGPAMKPVWQWNHAPVDGKWSLPERRGLMRPIPYARAVVLTTPGRVLHADSPGPLPVAAMGRASCGTPRWS